MDQALKIWLIVGAVLVILGLLIFTVVMSLNHWDFSKLGTIKYVTNTHTFNEEVADISILTDTADILFGVSDDDTCKVVCREQESLQHSVSVVDGTLTVKLVDQRKWYEYISISVGHSQVTVYLPQREYQTLVIKAGTADVALPRELSFDSTDISLSTGDVSSFASVAKDAKFKTSTGNIWVEGISPETLDLAVTTGHVTVSKVNCSGDLTVRVSTGKARLTEVACHDLTSTGSTGDMDLTHVVASGSFDLKRSTGDIRFSSCDAAQIIAKTTTGNVSGSLLSDKVFIAQTSTGRVKVPKTTTGGICDISTGTGDIEIQIED